jgi:hypothetical protein
MSKLEQQKALPRRRPFRSNTVTHKDGSVVICIGHETPKPAKPRKAKKAKKR